MNNHPTEAEKLRESINRFVSQSKLFESNVVPSLADTLAKIQQTTMQSLRPIYVPQLPESMFDSLRKTLKGIFPANWPSELPDFDRIEEVIEKDGIPIVHIPRAEIVQEICDAHDYDARVQILVDRASDIADDCRDALQRVYDEIVDKQLPLAQRAIEAYQAGYFESAQALAVSVCDTYLKKMYQGTRYADIQSDLTLDNSNEVAVAVAFNFHFALASAVPFLTPWNPARGEKPPTRLSRTRVSMTQAPTI
uniref:Uncharacterized protein n=1 Tax=Mycolicibacterium austroafricanum TaxID=39687 RepID=Q3YAT7_MYCAO|nr:unknown [Mycolicibacterium austroafricanum]